MQGKIMGHQAIPMNFARHDFVFTRSLADRHALRNLGVSWLPGVHGAVQACHGMHAIFTAHRKGSLGGLFLGGGFFGGLGRLGGFLVAEVVELFGVALGLGVFFGADFEVGEELAEEGGVLVLELEMGAAFACFDESDFDELLHMRGEIAITEAEDGTKLGDSDFMLLHEEKKAQAVGIGKSGEKGEQGGHGGPDAHHAEAGAARKMANVTKK
jgi:hypothetical protein